VIRLETPNGLPVHVPVDASEDVSPKFSPDEASRARAYYRENGYVVIRNVFPEETTSEARHLWEQEVKPFDGFMYRQATAKAERHVRNDKAWVMNPILNLQSIDPRYFGKLRTYVENEIFASPTFSGILSEFLDDRPKIVQSMYFEGNSATWEHQDSYYLDSEHIGSMIAAWIALEHISPEAGRFFVCPGSHRIDLGRQEYYNNIADNHDVYIGEVVAEIRSRGLEIRAPRLDAGDILLWNSRTIHGSLNSSDNTRSRSSITCHVIPARHRFLQLQTRIHDLSTDKVGDVEIFRPKDQAKLKNRLVMGLEGRFPTVFYGLKSMAIRYLMRKKA